MSVATHISSLPQAPLADSLGFDPDELSDQELVETMVAARRLASRVQAVELAAVAALARRRFAEAADRDPVVEVLSPADYVFDEVAEALTLTSGSAADLIRFATELSERLPGTFAALAGGDIDYPKAQTVWRGTDQVNEELTRTIEAKLLAKAPEQTTGQIRAKIRRLVKRLAPDAAALRREEAERRRGVVLVETDDGTAQLSGVDLPADAASAAYGRVAAIATGLRRDGDVRGIDQLRADVFLGLLRGTFTPGEPPADITDRPTPGPGAGDDGWNAVDDAIADVIAEAARTELTALTHALNDTRRDRLRGTRRDTHRHVADMAELIAGAGARIDHSLTGRSPITAPGAFREAHCETSVLVDQAGVRGGPSDAPTGDLGERDHDIGNLLAHAGARINRSLADLRDRWCVPGPAPGSVLSAVSDAVPSTALGRNAGAAIDAASGPGLDGEARPSHGVARYRPPAVMRRLIEHRDRRCCHPGCRRPVRHCDIDHSVPYHRGGATCSCNLAMLCRRHHRLKATKGWRVEHLWPGVLLWITPTGHWRITAPADRE